MNRECVEGERCVLWFFVTTATTRRTLRAGLGALRECGFEFDWIETADEWSAQRMAAYPLVVLTKIDNRSATDRERWLDEDVQQAFLEHVRSGGGLFIVHAGTVGVLELPAMRQLFGGAFVEHPPQCPVTVEPKIGHPLSAGSRAFTLRDEHYLMTLDDPAADLFLTTTSEHGTQPDGCTRHIKRFCSTACAGVADKKRKGAERGKLWR